MVAMAGMLIQNGLTGPFEKGQRDGGGSEGEGGGGGAGCFCWSFLSPASGVVLSFRLSPLFAVLLFVGFSCLSYVSG